MERSSITTVVLAAIGTWIPLFLDDRLTEPFIVVQT